jgi:hypothetical protein
MVPEWNYFMGVVRILKGAVSDLFPGFFISRIPLDNYLMLTSYETVVCPLITACRGFCLMLVDLMLTLLGCRIKHIRIDWPILERTIQSL